jgi:hypothetical protein
MPIILGGQDNKKPKGKQDQQDEIIKKSLTINQAGPSKNSDKCLRNKRSSSFLIFK